MLFIQYAVQALGAILVVLGYLNARAMKSVSLKHSYWTRLDETKASSELTEYIMSLASRGLESLVAVSAILCAAGLALGIAFSNLIYKNIERVDGADPVAIGVFGSQIIGFAALFLSIIAVFSAIESEKFGSLLNSLSDLGDWLVHCLGGIGAILLFYTMFRYSSIGFTNIHLIIDPIFSRPPGGFFDDVILNFATAVVILSLPALMLILVLAFGVAVINDKTSLSISEGLFELLYVSFIFIIGFVGSIFYTLSSGALGNSLQGQSLYPVTFQLVLSNAVFDGLTLYVTVSLMRWASASWRVRVALTGIEESLPRAPSAVTDDTNASQYSALTCPADELEERLARLEGLLFQLGKVNNEKEFRRFAIEVLNPVVSFRRQREISQHGLAELANIFTGGSQILMDRAMYRTAVQKDLEIPLIGYGRGKLELEAFDPEQSWLVYTVRFLIAEYEKEAELQASEKVAKGAAGTELSDSTIGSAGRKKVSNPVFDELFEATWTAINKDRQLLKGRPLIAIGADVVLASIFAYCSMFFGMIGKIESLSFEYLNTLFLGGERIGEFTNIGPLFWIMHTAFIPTLFLAAFLIFLFLSGYVVSPLINRIGIYFGIVEDIDKQKSAKQGHYLVAANLSLSKTGAMIASIGTLLMVWNKVIGFLAT